MCRNCCNTLRKSAKSLERCTSLEVPVSSGELEPDVFSSAHFLQNPNFRCHRLYTKSLASQVSALCRVVKQQARNEEAITDVVALIKDLQYAYTQNM